jgi:hypothetical protein
MISKTRQNNIKSNTIPIPINIENSKNQYGLKHNLFDPSKSTPPNIFMLKLYSRMVQYETQSLQNDPNFDNK